jgi:hypothetical protein
MKAVVGELMTLIEGTARRADDRQQVGGAGERGPLHGSMGHTT